MVLGVLGGRYGKTLPAKVSLRREAFATCRLTRCATSPLLASLRVTVRRSLVELVDDEQARARAQRPATEPRAHVRPARSS